MNQYQIQLERIVIEEPCLDNSGKEVRFITFNEPRLIKECQIKEAGEELLSCYEEGNTNHHPNARICLDFKGIDFVSPTMLAKCMDADKKQRTLYKKPLGMVHLISEIYEVFTITRLNRLFDIHRIREDYLRA